MAERVSPENKRILLLEPDRAARDRALGILTRAGYRVTVVTGVEEALREARARPPDAWIVSLPADPAAGDDAAVVLDRRPPGTPILLLADPSRVGDAVHSLRRGAQDYLLRPPDPLELRARLERALERQELDTRVAFLQEQLSKGGASQDLEARSPAMRRVLDRVRRVAPMRSTVLICGESGVGKELIARLIHFNSPRRDQPLIALNCAAIPTNLIDSELFGHEKGAFTGAYTRSRGKFEIAHRGTLFLDEIGDMDPTTQAKLLRVLEQREFMRVGGDQTIRVDVRLLAATNADLEALVADSAFRHDLYYRLKVVTITVPPLRERVADIPPLIERFLDELSRANAVARKTMSRQAVSALTGYGWPGNVRELKNLVESVLVSAPGDRIRVEDLPSALRESNPDGAAAGLIPGTRLADVERELIRLTLEHNGGNRTHSAAMLGIGVRTLQRKIRSYGLNIASKRRGAPRASAASEKAR